ncbi:MAG: hypothetical protein V1746_00870 [bacterium]
MKVISIEIAADMADEVLNAIKEKRSGIAGTLRLLDAQIALIENQIHSAPKPVQKAEALENGRVKRGESREAIREFLRNCNGGGATVADISRAIGIKYTTTYNAVTKLAKMKEIAHSGEKWRLL